MQTIQTFKELLNECRDIFMNGHNFEDWKQYKDFLLNNEEEVKRLINTATIPELSRYTWKDKKARMVGSVYNSLLTTVNLRDSFTYCPTEETYKLAFKRVTDAYTEADFLKYKEEKQAEQAAKMKAATNPETLEEFRTFIRLRGEKAMSEAQRVRYDELTADTRKAIQERDEARKTEVKKVENVTAEMEIKESTHTKKNIPLFVVVLSQRVDRATYEELNNRAKKLGGYYSSYNKGGAIPGFTFEKREAAELFLQVKESNVNAAELKAEQKEEKQQTAAEALREKGEKQIKEGEEELNRDRQDNTHRRATMAANAERAASAKIAFGKKLVKIAEAMEAGQIKYLDKLRAAADLETLQSILSMARHKHIREEKLNSNEYEINERTAFFVEMPYPVLYDGTKTELLKMQEYSPGKKLAAGRMLKRFKTDSSGNMEWIECNTPQVLEDYETLFCQSCIQISAWQVKSYKDRLLHVKRLQRMRIDNINSLRAAIRELLQLGKGATIDPEQAQRLKTKELERKYIGAKIPGFFPTPEELTEKKIQLLGIEDGDKICEPSAGLGHMADMVKAAGHSVVCVEIHTGLAEVLRQKGHEVINEDFLTHTGQYDKILMNPPFENLQDIDHVKHAFSLLNPGGRLVATMANNKHRKPEFLDWVALHGWYEENPAASFASAFNPTGVSTITVVLDK